MVEKPEYRGVVALVPAVSEKEQLELIAKYAPSETYTLGRDATHDDVIQQQRPPRAVVVSDAALLAEQRGNKDARFDSFLWFKGEIHRKPHSGFIVEARTGLRSDRPKDWAVMRRTAKRHCASRAQGRKSALNAKRGAKPWPPPGVTPPIKAAMRELWYTIKGKRTADDAAADIKKTFRKLAPGRTVLYREFGDPVMKKR